MEIFGKLLGAGAGFIGTAVRVALAGVGGWLVSKGVDAGVATNFTEAIIGVVTIGLSVLGSVLNNGTK